MKIDLSLQHLHNSDIVDACSDPDTRLNALVIDILSGKRGHADLVALIFRMGEIIHALEVARRSTIGRD